MAFADRLAALRKEHGLTQLQLAEHLGVHQTQIHRNESGASEPSMDALRRLARAPGVPADQLVFEPHERGPDDEFKSHFEALRAFDPDEKKVARALLNSLILNTRPAAGPPPAEGRAIVSTKATEPDHSAWLRLVL